MYFVFLKYLIKKKEYPISILAKFRIVIILSFFFFKGEHIRRKEIAILQEINAQKIKRSGPWVVGEKLRTTQIVFKSNRGF